MEKKPLQANLINIGANNTGFYIPQNSSGEIFKNIAEGIKSRMVDEKQLESNALRNEIARYYNYESTLFSDPNLYKDDAKYKAAKEDRETKYNDIMTKISESNLSQSERDNLIQEFNTKKSYLGNASYLRETNEMFQRNLTRIYGDITNNYDNAFIAAKNGNMEGVTYAVQNNDRNYDYLVSKHLMGAEEARQAKMQTMGQISIVAMVGQQCEAVMNNPDLDVAQKKKEIDTIINNFTDDKKLIAISKELSHGEKYSDPETLAKFMIGAKGNVKNIADRYTNEIVTNNHSNIQNPDGLSLDEQDNYWSMYQSGDTAGATEYAATRKGEVSPFVNRSSFYNNEGVQNKIYGTKFDLSNPDDYTVPKNTLTQDNVNVLSSIMTNPIEALGIPQEQWDSLSGNEQTALVMDAITEKVMQFTGAKTKIEAAKYIGGSIEMFKGTVVVKGTPMDIRNFTNMPTLIALSNDNVSGPEKERYLSYSTTNGYANFYSNLMDQYNSFDMNKKGVEDEIKLWKAQVTQSDFALPYTIMEDKNKPLIKASEYDVGIFTNRKYNHLERIITEELTNIHGKDITRLQIDDEITTFQAALQDEVHQQYITSLACGIFNAMDNNPYKQQALQSGITVTMLERTGAMDEAIRQFVRNRETRKAIKTVAAKSRYRIGG